MTAAHSSVETVKSFLACAEHRDFSRARELVDAHITRTGPDGDVKHGRDNYISYLESMLADAQIYRYELRRCVATEDGSSVLVEIDESLTTLEGTEFDVSEAMIFDITAEGLISKLTVYAREPSR